MARTQRQQQREPRRALALGATALSVLPAQFEAVEIEQGFRVSVNGLTVTGRPARERWERAGESLRVAERGGQFALGDWFNAMSAHYGDDVWQVVDAASGWNLGTLQVYGWVAERVGIERRRMDRLGIRHHLLVAPLTPEKQVEWLQAAANDEGEKPWTVSRLAKALKEGGDVPETAWWVLARATSVEDQDALMRQLETAGREVKAVARRSRRRE